jgi:spore maturation protein CgeB
VSRPLRILVIHPGASWSTADVFDGLTYGLQQHGVTVIPYRLDTRIELSHRVLHAHWRKKRQQDAALPKPNQADIAYHAGADALAMALREQVDVVLVVSAMLLHPDVIVLMKRAGLRVTVLFTESPYDHEHELKVAALVDGCWTNERSMVAAFRQVNACAGYLPHGWHPSKHAPGPQPEDAQVAAHDVVFVGSGFPERIQFFNHVDWTGIDLGLYGSWSTRELEPWLHPCIKGTVVANTTAAALYRRAKIGLNLYRSRNGRRLKVHGESLSPRAYELAACGAFSISDYRAEVPEVFGAAVPTFTTPAEAGQVIRQWLADDAGRATVAASLPALVAEASWVPRAATVLGDLSTMLHRAAA